MKTSILGIFVLLLAVLYTYAQTGRVYWRGTVDDRVQLVIRASKIETRVVSGTAYPEGTYSFTMELPASEVTVGVAKKKGRGSARIVEQPSEQNDFTAIVEIYDNKGGAGDYLLEIFW